MTYAYKKSVFAFFLATDGKGQRALFSADVGVAMGYLMNITRKMRCAFVQTRLWGKIMIEQRDISGIFCIIQKGDDILFFAIPHFVPS